MCGFQSGTCEVELVVGEKIRLTVNPDYYGKCDKNILFVDYASIVKICKPGNRIFIDDGLISVVVKQIGICFNLENSGG
jgi:pyruvate kinase